MGGVFDEGPNGILLRFATAYSLRGRTVGTTCRGGVVFGCPLPGFCRSECSGSVIALHSSLPLVSHALRTLMLDRCHLGIFRSRQLSVGPIILFGTTGVTSDGRFVTSFVGVVDRLSKGGLLRLFASASGPIVGGTCACFGSGNVSTSALTTRLQSSFTRPRYISMGSSGSTRGGRVLLGSLRSTSGPCETVFRIGGLSRN